MMFFSLLTSFALNILFEVKSAFGKNVMYIAAIPLFALWTIFVPLMLCELVVLDLPAVVLLKITDKATVEDVLDYFLTPLIYS